MKKQPESAYVITGYILFLGIIVFLIYALFRATRSEIEERNINIIVILIFFCLGVTVSGFGSWQLVLSHAWQIGKSRALHLLPFHFSAGMISFIIVSIIILKYLSSIISIFLIIPMEWIAPLPGIMLSAFLVSRALKKAIP